MSNIKTLAHLKRAADIYYPEEVVEAESIIEASSMRFEYTHSAPSLFSAYLSDNQQIKKQAEHEKTFRAVEAFLIALARTSASVELLFYCPTSFALLKDLGQSQDIVVRILDWLEQNQFIRKVSSGSNLTQKATCFELTKFIDPNSSILVVNTSKGKVIVKDKNSEQIALDTEELEKLSSNLAAINHHLQQSNLSLAGVPLPIGLNRIFSNASLKLHGRFYDAYMNIPSANRKHLTIDGEQTIVIDFKSMAARMLYAHKGEVLAEDPYDIEDYERAEVKAIFNRMLNVTGPEMVIKSLVKSFDPNKVKEHEEEIKKLMQQIIEQNKPIAEFFFPKGKDSNLIAMYLESRLVESILLESISEGLTLFPIHDAFVVKRSDQERAITLIHECFNKIYPSSKPVATYPLVSVEE